MEGLKMIPMLALTIAIAGVMIGASAIALSRFDATVTTCYNASYNLTGGGGQFRTAGNCRCLNATPEGGAPPTTSVGEANMTFQGFSICQAQEAEGDLAGQLPTVAIIGVMVIIISIIAGVFVYMRYFA